MSSRFPSLPAFFLVSIPIFFARFLPNVASLFSSRRSSVHLLILFPSVVSSQFSFPFIISLCSPLIFSLNGSMLGLGISPDCQTNRGCLCLVDCPLWIAHIVGEAWAFLAMPVQWGDSLDVLVGAICWYLLAAGQDSFSWAARCSTRQRDLKIIGLWCIGDGLVTISQFFPVMLRVVKLRQGLLLTDVCLVEIWDNLFRNSLFPPPLWPHVLAQAGKLLRGTRIPQVPLQPPRLGWQTNRA